MPLYKIIMFLFPKLDSCCKEAEDNLPTEGMPRPGGVAAKCHQPSLLGSDINCIRGWWANSGKVEVHQKAHPEPSQRPWRQASEVCSLKSEIETSWEELDQTRCDRVPVLPYIVTCWPVCLKGPKPGYAYGPFHNEGLHLIILFSDFYLTSLSLGTLAAVKLDQLANKIMFRDIAKLSGVHQTFMVEALHSLVNHFAPKMYSNTSTGFH